MTEYSDQKTPTPILKTADVIFAVLLIALIAFAVSAMARQVLQRHRFLSECSKVGEPEKCELLWERQVQ